MLLSCSNETNDISKSKAYKIFIINEDDKPVYGVHEYFTEYDMSSEKFYVFPKLALGTDNATVNPDIKDRDITINNITEKYNYEYSYYVSKTNETYLLNSFKHPVYDTTVLIYADSNEINSVKFGNYKFRITETPIKTENELLSICNDFLSRYTNLSNTTPTINTETRNAENQIINHYQGFKDITAAKTVYWINYGWSKGEFSQYSMASITITKEGEIIRFGVTKKSHADLLNNTDIDINRVDYLITEKVKKLCQNNLGYTFDSIKSTQKNLKIVEERLCVRITVFPLLIPPDGGSAVEGKPISFLITL